jgi:hypothetical protein
MQRYRVTGRPHLARRRDLGLDLNGARPTACNGEIVNCERRGSNRVREHLRIWRYGDSSVERELKTIGRGQRGGRKIADYQQRIGGNAGWENLRSDR